MTEERLKEIKRIFGQYRKNLSLLRQMQPPGISGVSYDKIPIMTDKSRNGVEQLMITYLIDKEKLEKEVALVDSVYEHFADNRDVELSELIDMRFRQGKPHWEAANDCYVSDRQALRWLEKAYAKAEEIGSEMGVF